MHPYRPINRPKNLSEVLVTSRWRGLCSIAKFWWYEGSVACVLLPEFWWHEGDVACVLLPGSGDMKVMWSVSYCQVLVTWRWCGLCPTARVLVTWRWCGLCPTARVLVTWRWHGLCPTARVLVTWRWYGLCPTARVLVTWRWCGLCPTARFWWHEGDVVCVLLLGSGDMKVMQFSVQTGKKIHDLQVSISLLLPLYIQYV